MPLPASELPARIAASADPRTAAELARYFQVRPGGYGAGDQFAGLRLRDLRGLVKPYGRVRFVAADWLPLLQSPVHEHRLAALVVMAERAGRGAEPERGEIYATYLANTAAVNNWDLVDLSSPEIVGGWLLDRDRSRLDLLAGSELLWQRRIAMVATHRFIRAGQSADTYRLALTLLGDQEHLIHKAVGWMLREAGKRVDGAELRAFLDRHAAELARTTLRYAVERFPAEERQHYLRLRR